MEEYYAKEYLEDAGYTGASGWGYHNDVMYAEALNLLEKGQKNNDKMLLVVKTLDMHQPYPYYGTAYGDSRKAYATANTLPCAAFTG